MRQERKDRLAALLLQQERRQRQRQDDQAKHVQTQNKLKTIKAVQGNRYAYKILEKEFEENVVLPEIARQKQILEDKK